jgi:hypothetical protein
MMLTCALRAFGLLTITVLALPALADERINTTADDLASQGYDTVAYFTDGRPVKGRPDFEYGWQDAKWRFATAEHRDLFADAPERYAPQFGGFCTGGLSLGYMIKANPEDWSIIDGRLFLNSSRPGRDRLRGNPGPIISEAETTWDRFGHGFAVVGDGF